MIDVYFIEWDDSNQSMAKLPVLAYASLSTALKQQGLTSRISTLDRFSSISERHGKPELLRLIKDIQPRVVGVSVLSAGYALRKKATEMISSLENPPVIVWGNALPTAIPKTLFQHTPEIDYIVRGFGENSFPKLVMHILNGESPLNLDGIAYKENGGVIVNKPSEVDFPSLPIADLEYRLETLAEVMNISHGDATGIDVQLEISRANCRGSCTFCTNPLFVQNRDPEKTYRRPEDVFEEMQIFISHSFNRFYLGSVDILSHGEYIERLVDLIEGDGAEVILSFPARADEIVENRELIHRLFRSKYIQINHVEVGFEAASDNALRLINKRTTAATNQEAISILRPYTKSYKPSSPNEPRLSGDFIMFTHPDMTYEDLQANEAFEEQHRSLFSCGVSHLRAYPGTPFWRQMVARGYKPDPEKGFSIVDYKFTDPRVQREFEKYRDFLVQNAC